MTPMIGSLFSGYGGLDMGVQDVFGGIVTWHFEYDEAPSKILAHHWPWVPNYGDVTTIDWADVTPVDIITAGYPCQPFSTAGSRKGSDDERHLWPYVLEAIRQIRPGLVVLENVRGHLSLGFDAVQRDLAEAGYDAEWICLRASDAGAPHRRERIFILAKDTHREPRDQWWLAAPGQEEGGWAWAYVGRRGGAPATDPSGERGERWGGTGDLAGTSRAGEGEGDQREWDGDAADDRGSTPSDSDDAARDGERSRTESGQGDTPVTDSDRSGLGGIGRLEPEQRDTDGRGGTDQLWGQYEPAIRRWESVLGRFAPSPTLPDGRSGNPRLSPGFVEWMMGLPAGHVTDTGIDRKAQLKALGNGVVPQQAALALTALLVPAPHHSKTDGENA